MKIYTQKNFHKHTFCLWQEVPFDSISALNINHKSESGSNYFFTPKGVYRVSNHWGRVANCRWRLLSLENYKNQQFRVGFASWVDFYPNDETTKLFFIKADFVNKKISFSHKFSSDYDGKATLRTASETFKIIKIIKEIQTETSWSRYLQFDDLDSLRKEITVKLTYSNNSFIEIKKEYL